MRPWPLVAIHPPIVREPWAKVSWPSDDLLIDMLLLNGPRVHTKLWLALILGSTAAAKPQDGPQPYFEANVGQSTAAISFLSHTPGYTLALDRSGAAIFGLACVRGASSDVIRMEIMGGHPKAPVGLAHLESVTHWYGGGDPAMWHADVPHYASVSFASVYPGIDVSWHIRAGKLEYEFVVAAGADPGMIRLQFYGGRGLAIDDRGDLVVGTDGDPLRFRRPRGFQQQGSRTLSVAARFRLIGDVVEFDLGPYDRNRLLVIDPIVTYASYIGGSGYDAIYAVTTDPAGNIYLAGETASSNFPGTAGITRASRDAFVTKLTPDGSNVVYTTILASNGNDSARALSLDAAGNLWVAGVAGGTGFPVKNALFPNSGGQEDAFLARLDGVGHLSYATYLGGGGTDVATGLGIDSAGNVYVAGYTSSVQFPTTAAAPQRNYGGGISDAFIAKLNAAGTALLYSTLLGGPGADSAAGLAVSAEGVACIAGSSNSDGLPTSNGYQPVRAGGTDAFVGCLNPIGTAWTYGTYLGGVTEDIAYAIALDTSGNIYVAGATYSPDFPVTSGAAQATKNNDYDAFVAILNPAGKTLAYSTLMGGNATDVATAIATNGVGVVWIAGYTTSTDFPLRNPSQAAYGGGFDAFVVELNTNGGGLIFSTYLGSAGDDRAASVAPDVSQGAIVAGFTSSVNLSVTPGALQTLAPGNYSGFLARFSPDPLPPSVVSVSPASGSGSSQVFTITVSDPNGGADVNDGLFMVGGSSSGACWVLYFPSTNQILLADDAGTAWLTPIVAGSAATVSNSQCTLNAASSSLTVAGVSVTANLSLSFKNGFSGSMPLYALAAGRSGLSSGWQMMGSWVVGNINQPPSITSVSPASGSGSSQVFTITVSDPNGGADVNDGLFMVGGSSSGACWVLYFPSTNQILLADDAGTAWLTPIVAGSAATVSNSQCTLNAASSSLTVAGVSVTANLSLSFKNGFSGSMPLYALAAGRSGLSSGWQMMGSWVVGNINQPPSITSVSPASGSGSSQVFTITVSDPNGGANVNDGLFMVGGSSSGACWVLYFPSTNQILLADDAGTAWLTPIVAGSAATVSNSQCTLNAASSSLTVAGVSVTANLSLSFKNGFSGSMPLYALAAGRSGLSSGWQMMGSWVVGNINQPPSITSVSPASGSGSSQVFTITVSDPNGGADVNDGLFMVGESSSGACWVLYFPSTNQILLADDAGTAWLTPILVGSAATVSNSQCTLNAVSSSFTVAGVSVTANLSLSFKSGFSGSKPLYALAADRSGLSSGWYNMGSWTAP